MTAPRAADVIAELDAVADATDATNLQRFFKTGPGEYGEGDVFIGVRVPATRKVAKQFVDLPLDELDALLDSDIHEHRLAALVIMNGQFARASRTTSFDEAAQELLVERYLAAVRRGRVNNWDLVDVSAENILGPWLFGRPRDLLFELAVSDVLWERRVAMLSTFEFIKRGDTSTTYALAEILLPDRVDLMQKAVGWMLRESGKRVDRRELVAFLNKHAGAMGRTALSYATEHFEPEERGRLRRL